MISAARFPYLSSLAAAARARSRLGGSCASHSMQLLALVMAAAMGCLISCASDAAISPNVLTRLVCARSASSAQIAGAGKDGMANSVDPLHLSVRKKNTEFLIVIGFFHDCPFDRARPHKAILRVDAFEIFFPSRGSLSWIEAVNPVPLLGEVHRLPIR